MKIDLNCDMGENIPGEAEIMPYITSANIACGFHAGDEETMRATVRLAQRYGVAVGAHPSWKDKAGFGRNEMTLPPQAVESLVWEQVYALAQVAQSQGVKLRHVKPHGALYNQAARDRSLAKAIARAVKRMGGDLVLVGLAGYALIEAGLEYGLTTASEAFPDRNYNPDGTLVSRAQPHALLMSPEEVAAHAVELARDGVNLGGRRVAVQTLCLHGDHPRAVENVKRVRQALEKAGFEVAAL
jgi:UPF0271 protein